MGESGNGSVTVNQPYLGAGGLHDAWVGALGGPGDALHHMLMLPQLGLALFGRHNPHAHGLVVGAAGDQRAVRVGPHHAHPLPVAGEGLHTVPDLGDGRTGGDGT